DYYCQVWDTTIDHGFF
nr:immunoglobulin light chain junction region [Macaca mulatta]MOV65812.1 immunoglobulin light chain junction region [Macaca mulatta]MOV65815.1 immunoglobulin light chain junction region [Macaca mulatta]MOV65906.1 immunoglobulin light chain junction region [Macaca mulatta]MOV65932.1 immunoglobulin light chain junction region [Macaca mulatta]